MKTMTENIKEYRSSFVTRVPEEKRKIMERAIVDLKDLNLASKALKKGDSIPAFTLPNESGEETAIHEKIQEKEFSILVFYRGGWCPYCNFELNGYNQNIDGFNEAGAQIIAISPQLPDNSLSTIEKNSLGFSVLSDVRNAVAKEFALIHGLPEDLREIYSSFNIDVSGANGDETFELPMGATYVVDKEGKILFSFVNEDYRERAEPLEVLAFIKSL